MKIKSNKKILMTIIKACIAVGLLYYFARNNDLKEIWLNFKLLSLPIWFAVIVFTILDISIKAKKWQKLIPEYSFLKLAQIMAITGFYTLVLPGQLASEAVKAYILGKQEKDMERVSASVLVDKLTGLSALLILGMIGVLFSQTELGSYMTIAFVAGSVIMVSVLFLINVSFFEVFLLNITGFFKSKFKVLNKLVSFAERLILSWKEFCKNQWSILISIFYGILFQFFACLLGVIFSNAVGMNIPLIDWFWIQAILTLALLLPVTIGGIGIREGTLIGVLGALGVPSELAIVISFGFFGQQIIRAAFGGVLELMRNAKITAAGDTTEKEG